MEIESAVGRTPAQILRDILTESKTIELDSVPIRKWGRFGPNSPYDVILREDVLKSMLSDVMGWKPQEVKGVAVEFLGPRPWKLGSDSEFLCPKELLDSKKLAIIEEDKVSKNYHFVIALFNIWSRLKHDGDLIWRYSKRPKSRKTEKGWVRLQRDTKQVMLTPELRAIVESEGKERVLDEIDRVLSQTGSRIIRESIIHEDDHKRQYKTTYQVWLHKRDWEKRVNEDLEEKATQAEERYIDDPRFLHLVSFRTNFRRTLRRAV